MSKFSRGDTSTKLGSSKDHSPQWLIGVDIGGTFTDVVALDRGSGGRASVKVLTSPDDPLVAVLQGLEKLLGRYDIGIGDVDHLVHATTLASNTLLERNGPRVGLLTTDGFRDILEQGREDRFDIYDLMIEVQKPLVERRDRIGIEERTDAQGHVVRLLDIDAVQKVAEYFQREQIESVAICFLNSFRNPENEEAAADCLRKVLPSAYISLSSKISPVIREYERFLATAINAYVGPKVSSYLNRMTVALGEMGFGGTLGIMKSDGTIYTPDEATRFAVRILESGPAAGVISAALVARECNESLAIAFDMGGTTAKASLVSNGNPTIVDEMEVSRLERFVKGSGLPVRVPSVDVLEVGVGGGSLASIDSLGLLQVGPESAGADPGPACFGRGGRGATVTDANLVLGYLNPKNFAGGDIHLELDLARTAIEDHVASSTGVSDVVEAAWGIRDLVNENMARAVRLQCVEHGIDPARATIIATGGGGPVHAGSLLEKLGCRSVICPLDPGVSSGFGLLFAPRAVDQTTTEFVALEETSSSQIEERLARLEAELRERVPYSTIDFHASRHLDMRLRGQGYEIRIPIEHGVSEETLTEAFQVEYARRFGRRAQQGPLEIVNWTVRLIEQDRNLAIASGATEHASDETGNSTRRLYFGPTVGWVDALVLNRRNLSSVGPIPGPLVVEEAASTTVVAPGQILERDDHGNLHVYPEQSPPDTGAI